MPTSPRPPARLPSKRGHSGCILVLGGRVEVLPSRCPVAWRLASVKCMAIQAMPRTKGVTSCLLRARLWTLNVQGSLLKSEIRTRCVQTFLGVTRAPFQCSMELPNAPQAPHKAGGTTPQGELGRQYAFNIFIFRQLYTSQLPLLQRRSCVRIR